MDPTSSTLSPSLIAGSGAIIAALITGAISFVHLVIAKEQKISEFRQSWIDSLRDDLSMLFGHLANVGAEWELLCLSNERSPDNIEDIADFHSRVANDVRGIATAQRRILLRLNPDEHKDLIAEIQKLTALQAKPAQLKDPDVTADLFNSTTAVAQKILKTEWQRVKRGEKVFYFTQRFALVFFGLLLAGSLTIAIWGLAQWVFTANVGQTRGRWF